MIETKDAAANVTTLAGAGTAIMGWNEALTLVLIITGIILNAVRIYSTYKKKDPNQ